MMPKPILKQRSDAQIQGLYLAQGRDVPKQIWHCRIASQTQPDTNQSYWLYSIAQETLKPLSIDFVNLDKQVPAFVANARMNLDAIEIKYREFELWIGDTEAIAQPVQQDNSYQSIIWELILSL